MVADNGLFQAAWLVLFWLGLHVGDGMKGLLSVICALVCFVAVSSTAATNVVTVAWQNPKGDVEGNALPTNAVASYEVLLGHSQDLSDAVVATERHADGDIRQSIRHAVEKKGLSEQLARVFMNTVDELEPSNRASQNT